MKQGKSNQSTEKRLADYLKKVKHNKPAIYGNSPSGKINKSDKGFKDD